MEAGGLCTNGGCKECHVIANGGGCQLVGRLDSHLLELPKEDIAALEGSIKGRPPQGDGSCLLKVLHGPQNFSRCIDFLWSGGAGGQRGAAAGKGEETEADP